MRRNMVKVLKKVGVALIGFPIVIIGLILIPLPGPGLLITLAGLFILALEFEWAEKHLENFKIKLKTVIEKSRSKKN